MTAHRGPRLLPLAALAGALACWAGPARADYTVTACSSDMQAGANVTLAQALAGGGAIRFACPPGTRIRVTRAYVLTTAVTIDGGNTVTFDGQGFAGTMLQSTQPLTIRHIAFHGFVQPPPFAVGRPISVSVISGAGPTELDDVTVDGSQRPVMLSGKSVVTNSTFSNNRGIALWLGSAPQVQRSNFTGNELALGVFNGSGSIQDSSFSGQSSTSVLIQQPIGDVQILRSRFTGNKSTPLRLSGRAFRGDAVTVSVRANVFRDNDGGAKSGAVGLFDTAHDSLGAAVSASEVARLEQLPLARMVSAYNRFENNRGANGGAVEWQLAPTQGLVSTGDVFVGNVATGDGGGLVVSGGAVQITHALFKNNRAGGRGAAFAIGAAARASVGNTLVIGNAGPAGAISGGRVTAANLTVAGNDAAGLTLSDPAARVTNTILANNRPANCAGMGQGIVQGNNAVSDASCTGRADAAVELDALFVPTDGSPALRGGDAAVCRAAPVSGVDLAFQPRRAAGCALGVFERAPAAKLAQGVQLHEQHADATDDFSDADGYKPPPPRPSAPGQPSPPNNPTPSDLPVALRGSGIDYSVSRAEITDWLGNSEYTPYPAITAALLQMLSARPLRQPVFLDVIVWNYEHGPGSPSPRKVADVDPERVKAALLAGSNERHGTAVRRFEDLLQ